MSQPIISSLNPHEPLVYLLSQSRLEPRTYRSLYCCCFLHPDDRRHPDAGKQRHRRRGLSHDADLRAGRRGGAAALVTTAQDLGLLIQIFLPRNLFALLQPHLRIPWPWQPKGLSLCAFPISS